MRRKPPEERLERLVEAAIKVFMRAGYRRAQIADIAREMGVAAGTIYLYVESKEALFDLALQRACGNMPPLDMRCLPLPTPSADEILAHVRAEFDKPGFVAGIQAAQNGRPADDIAAELSLIVTELYGRVHRRRRALSIIETSALDWPELFSLFYGVRRDLLRDLAEYLERRAAQGQLRPIPDPPAAARLILETVAWFAYHRFDDPEPDAIAEETARATVLDALVNAYVVRA